MIQAENLTKKFRDFTALNAMHCRIPEGCIYGLVGSNGAGKSTFLRLLTGVYRPDSGEVQIDGEIVYENPKIKEVIAYVPDPFIPGSTEAVSAIFWRPLNWIPQSRSAAIPRECAGRRQSFWRFPADRNICSLTRPSTAWTR